MIYLLGGKGFVGSAFARMFTRLGEPFTIVTRENSDQVSRKSCDILINASGNSKKWLGEKDPLKEFAESVGSVREILVKFRFGAFIQISSCDVYADCSRPEWTSEETPLDMARQSVYGHHKYLAELCVEKYGRPWMIFRAGGMVGPGLWKNPVFDILNEKTLGWDLRSEFQYLSTDDLARLVWSVLGMNRFGETFNLCGRGTLSLADILHLAGKDNIAVRDSAPLVRYEVNLEKISRVLPLPETRTTLQNFITGTSL